MVLVAANTEKQQDEAGEESHYDFFRLTGKANKPLQTPGTFLFNLSWQQPEINHFLLYQFGYLRQWNGICHGQYFCIRAIINGESDQCTA
jgi:hypothetical protein